MVRSNTFTKEDKEADNNRIKFRCDTSTKMASSPVSSPVSKPRFIDDLITHKSHQNFTLHLLHRNNRAAELRRKSTTPGGGKSRSGSINSIAPATGSSGGAARRGAAEKESLRRSCQVTVVEQCSRVRIITMVGCVS